MTLLVQREEVASSLHGATIVTIVRPKPGVPSGSLPIGTFGPDLKPSSSRPVRPGPPPYRPGVDRCDGCGFLYDEAEATTVAGLVVPGAREIAAELADAGAGVRSRPAPDVWSRLEYACHVRDVLLVQRERVLLARRVQLPEVEPMGRDERVDHDGYGGQDPLDVARQLVDAAGLFAGVLRRLPVEAWERTVVYNWPVRAERSLRWVAVNALHEVRHHLGDVRAQTTGPAR
jgi:hypothetical protein